MSDKNKTDAGRTEPHKPAAKAPPPAAAGPPVIDPPPAAKAPADAGGGRPAPADTPAGVDFKLPGRAAAPPETPAEPPEDRAARLERENAELRRLLAAGVTGPPPAAAAPQFVGGPAVVVPRAGPVPAVPGSGGVVWEGSIPKDPLAPRVLFRLPGGSEADAKEAYKRAAGITAAEHEIAVTRVGG